MFNPRIHDDGIAVFFYYLASGNCLPVLMLCCDKRGRLVQGIREDIGWAMTSAMPVSHSHHQTVYFDSIHLSFLFTVICHPFIPSLPINRSSHRKTGESSRISFCCWCCWCQTTRILLLPKLGIYYYYYYYLLLHYCHF